MKLSVSNIAWELEEQDEVLNLFQSKGVSGVEVAPTKYWPGWQGAEPAAAINISEDLNTKGLSIPALQAILFDKPDLQVFSDSQGQTNLLLHLELVAQLAKAFNADVLVFGSPKNRDPGSRSSVQAFDEAVKFFQRAASICAKYSVCLCLEPNPKVYNCKFMTHWQEIREMVNAVSHPGVGIHLDTACIHLEGDNVVEAINECGEQIKHFHITEPNLADLTQLVLDHASIGKALKSINYNKWLSIEMRRSDNPLVSIERSIDLVQENYS